MNIDISEKQFRRLIDLVYIGNWVLNSTREFHDRIVEYDEVERHLLGYCRAAGMTALVENTPFGLQPSRAFEDGGIQEAIADYEDAVFFDILAEDLARRDMEIEGVTADDARELDRRREEYLDEFELNGLNNIVVEKP
ncbi:MAG: hypothetical protein LBN02_03560 [Oscillospiraceae bacterium]|jgi:hypothetical protein|nr:hypothetical protein [Oscillospiraceae bacterium]